MRTTLDSCSDELAGWNVNLLNSPANGARCGGDWCDAFALGPDHVAISIGDVSGHGEAVAEAMDVVRSAVAGSIYEGFTPSTTLCTANTAAHDWGDGTIATATVGTFNRRLHTLTFSNAGHPPPLIVTATGEGFLSPPVGDLPLGIFRKYRSADYVVAVPEGALIVFYTDGVVEHRRDILRGERELVEICRDVRGLAVPDAAAEIAHRIFKKGRGHDDAAIVTLRCECDR